MTEWTWTNAELKQLNRIMRRCEARNAITEASGRAALYDFVKLHGQPKVDAMAEALEKKNAKPVRETKAARESRLNLGGR